MTRWLLPILALSALLAGCGKYGAPIRPVSASAQVGGSSAGTVAPAPAHEGDACQDPSHDHTSDPDDRPGDETDEETP